MLDATVAADARVDAEALVKAAYVLAARKRFGQAWAVVKTMQRHRLRYPKELPAFIANGGASLLRLAPAGAALTIGQPARALATPAPLMSLSSRE